MSLESDNRLVKPQLGNAGIRRGGQNKASGNSLPHIVSKTVRSLSVENLGKQYEGRPVVRGVSLSIQRGEVVGLLGPNGAGKTTCFYIITGLIKPDYGTILLNEQDITELPMYRRARLGLGYLPQEASIFRGLTVEQNIRAVLEVVEKSFPLREELLEELLGEFSITHLRRTPSLALSGGERRRVEIARTLASKPDFVLLDEPLAGIDPIRWTLRHTDHCQQPQGGVSVGGTRWSGSVVRERGQGGVNVPRSSNVCRIRMRII